MPLTRKQLALIHLAKKQLQLDDEDYRALLKAAAGVASAKELDKAGFDRVMECFEGLGFQSSRRPRTFGKRAGMATPAQVDYIRSLWQQFSGRDDEKSLNRWLEHWFGVSSLRFADSHVAGQALTALKAMVGRQKKGRADEGPQ